MDDTQLQLVLAIAMFLTTVTAGFAPVKLLKVIKKRENEASKASWSLTLMSCFAGGVFLATCFLDIIPHVNSNFRRFNEESGLQTGYPMPELIACIGFFAVYLLEELCARLFSSHHSHSYANNLIEMRESNCKILEKTNHGDDVGTNCNRQHNEYDSLRRDNPRRRSMEETLRKAEFVSVGLLQSITFAVAMSFHSVLEGLALGVQDNKVGIMTLFFSLVIHKGIEAFSVGLQVSRCNSDRMKMVAVTIFVYSLMTPVGSMIGVFIQNMNMNTITKDGLIVLLEALAVGTFIYVTFFEVLATERANEYSNLMQLVAIIIGFSVIALFQLVELFLQTHSH